MDVLIPSLEELEEIFKKPCDYEEVMRSMEHLYAVPSEKLRVWTVWLTNVGEIADEWHKWLRMYIDLITRIAESLQMATDDVPAEKLKLLKDEEKMIETLKNLTHQATLYRSYYKHWKNIADQATKEVVSRKVTPTAMYQRRFELPVIISQNAQHLIEEAESAEKPTEETTPDVPALMPTLNEIDSMDSLGQNELGTTPMTTKSSDDLIFLPEIVPVLPPHEAIAKREAARKLIMDMPSADQSPYFFYLRTEPDIDIAIEHNDEKVIPPDPNLERISANRKYLYFNLSEDK